LEKSPDDPTRFRIPFFEFCQKFSKNFIFPGSLHSLKSIILNTQEQGELSLSIAPSNFDKNAYRLNIDSSFQNDLAFTLEESDCTKDTIVLWPGDVVTFGKRKRAKKIKY